jgi:hypothetical protein
MRLATFMARDADIKRCRMVITLIILSTDTFIIRTVTIAMIMVRLRWSDRNKTRSKPGLRSLRSPGKTGVRRGNGPK